MSRVGIRCARDTPFSQSRRSTHLEGSWPHTVERLGQTFKDVPRDEVARLVGLSAAEVYGFDLEQLAPLAAQHGPRLERIGCP